MNFLRVLTFIFLISIASGAPSGLLKPSQDDFYDPPSGYESKPEGAILKWRNTPAKMGATFMPLNIANSWQALVRTTDSHGNATAIVTTIMKPHNANSKQVISYQSMEDSANENCAPSYSLQFGSDANTLVLKAESYIIQIALERGYYVVTPDYEGPNAAFTAGRIAGHAVLDSLRATIQSANETGIAADASYALFGYSGGSLASGWAASLQPTYAPELKSKLIGATLGGFVTNITETVTAVEGTVFAGLTPNGLWGLSQEYPFFKEYLKQGMSEEHYKKLKTASENCLLNAILGFPFYRFFSGSDPFFKKGWDVFKEDDIKQMLDENTLLFQNNQEIPDIPLMIYHATNDEIVPYHGNSDRYYDNICKWKPDISLELNIDQTGGHILEIPQGVPAAFAWLERLFRGQNIVKGCHKTTRLNNLLYPGADYSIYTALTAAIKSLVGGEIGPNGEGLPVS